MGGMADSFYTPTADPEVYVATERTEGPWSPGAQHAGPPSALLVRAIERLPTSMSQAQVVRVGADILGPVPLGELRVAARIVRPGRTVELAEATLIAGGRPAMVARAWRMRVAEPLFPIPAPAEPPAVLPEDVEEAAPTWPGGYLTSVEWRFAGGEFEKPGPATVWARQRVPLVDGEEPSPLQRAVTVADSGNGLSGLLDPVKWWFVNTELTVHVTRPPQGEWINVSAASTYDPAGVGIAETSLSDRTGRFGRGAQALLVGPR
jgi:hypothetical protein